MKGKDFADVLNCYANLFRDIGAVRDGAAIQSLATYLHTTGNSAVATTCRGLAKLKPSPSYGRGEIGRFLTIAEKLRPCLVATAKKAVIDDLNRLIATLEPFANLSISYLIQAAQEQKAKAPQKKKSASPALSDEGIAAYVEKLTEALTDADAFIEVYDTLKKDSAVKADTAKKISKAFARRSGKTKTEALKLIWDRHASVLSAKGRADAIGERTAG